MHFFIKTLSPGDSLLSSKIVSLMGRCCIPQLSSYFIYREPEYLQYFTKLINNSTEAVFYAEKPDTAEIIGATILSLKMIVSGLITSASMRSTAPMTLVFTFLKKL